MTLRRALKTTVEDWWGRWDPTTPRWHRVVVALVIVPLVPIVALLRTQFEEPERNPNFAERSDA